VALEKELRPTDLTQRIRSIVLSSANGLNLDEYDDRDDAEDNGSSWERTEALAQQLGVEASNDEDVLNSLLPDAKPRMIALMRDSNSNRRSLFA
jgi:hypothetical protein